MNTSLNLSSFIADSGQMTTESLHHDLAVAPYTTEVRTSHEVVMNNHDYINNYTPMFLEPHVWTDMAGFIRDTVHRQYSEGRKLRDTERALSTLTSFAEWVLITGVTSVDEAALNERVINSYTSHRKSEVEAPVAERERKLMRTLAGLANTVEKRTVATTATPSTPYSLVEQEEIRYWAHWQQTDYRTRNATAIATLALGCGLTTAEMARVREQDVVELADGMLGVQLADRTIPVLAAWNDELASTLTGTPSQYLVSPKSEMRDKPAMTSTLQICGPGSPSPQRMRATWLLAHVDASTNVFALMAAAGLSAPDFLRRLASFASFTPASEQAASFRLATEVK
ncbi:hypothetical protein ACFY9N_03775 [Microbacterium sp. NPDC008134]|uniref:hypothetical protein n=1 Tax=Microbacterium sp. NPDC008134 TaxID=3364183 RepID=UPI0036E1F8BB